MALLIFHISFLKSQAHPHTGSSQAMKGMRTRILRKMLRHLSFLPAAAGADASPQQHHSISSTQTKVQSDMSQGTPTFTDLPQAMDPCAPVN